MLPKIQHCTEQSLITKTFPAPNVNRAEAEKSCLNVLSLYIGIHKLGRILFCMFFNFT